MRTFLKALVAIVLVAIIAGASFLTGFGVNQLIASTQVHPRAGEPATSTPTPSPTQVHPRAGESEHFDLFWEAWQIIEQEFFGELPDPKQLTYGAIQGALRALDDPATMLVEPMPSEDQMNSMNEDMAAGHQFVNRLADLR